MAKIFRTLRNNWKKSVFFSGLAVWGVRYGWRKYEESETRRVYCEEARKYGEELTKVGAPLKKITIFLNPASNNGKGKKLFEKNVAPYFYLSGMEVTVVKTEYEGQAKKYMEVLDHADMVVVAGGNGTVLEVVTGLLRRHAQDGGKMLPIGVIPLGHTNSLASYLFQKGSSEVKLLADASMSVIKGFTKPIDVMHIQGENDKSVFATSSVHWGVFRECEENKIKKWWIGPLKHYWVYIRRVLSTWPPQVHARFSYAEPCEGCSRCVETQKPPPWKWWHFLLPPTQPVIKKDYSKIENENCGVVSQKDFTSLEFRVQTRNCTDNPLPEDDVQKSLAVSIEPENMSKMEFIKEGSGRKDGTIGSNPEVIKVGQFSLEPVLEQDTAPWFMIDNEEFEAMKINVKLLPNRLNFFCNNDENNTGTETQISLPSCE